MKSRNAKRAARRAAYQWEQQVKARMRADYPAPTSRTLRKDRRNRLCGYLQSWDVTSIFVSTRERGDRFVEICVRSNSTKRIADQFWMLRSQVERMVPELLNERPPTRIEGTLIDVSLIRPRIKHIYGSDVTSPYPRE